MNVIIHHDIHGQLVSIATGVSCGRDDLIAFFECQRTQRFMNSSGNEGRTLHPPVR